jgi:hypothetical protein
MKRKNYFRESIKKGLVFVLEGFILVQKWSNSEPVHGTKIGIDSRGFEILSESQSLLDSGIQFPFDSSLCFLEELALEVGGWLNTRAGLLVGDVIFEGKQVQNVRAEVVYPA